MKRLVFVFMCGLIVRNLEVLLHGDFLYYPPNWNPLIYILYGIGFVLLFVLCQKALSFAVGKLALSVRLRIALSLCLIFYLLLTVSINVDLSALHGYKIFTTFDWFFNGFYNFLVLLIPAIVFASVGVLLIVKLSNRNDVQKSFNYNYFLSIGVSLAVIAESIVLFNIKIPAESANNPNIILLSVDSLRKDHLSCYGYDRLTSPAIDSFFKNAVFFDRCVTQTSKTLPSYATIFTGAYANKHMVFNNARRFDLEKTRLTTIPVEMKNKGYRCVAHLSGDMPGAILNMNYCFDDVYQHGVHVKSVKNLYISDLLCNLYYGLLVYLYKDNRVVAFINRSLPKSLQCNTDVSPSTEKAVEWLKEDSSGPFFAHIYWHYPHFPYGDSFNKIAAGMFTDSRDREPYCDGDTELVETIKKYRSGYDRDIFYTDFQFSQIVKAARENDLCKNTVFILTADHGEVLAENYDCDSIPRFGHGRHIYDADGLVPLIFRLPGPEKSRIDIDEPVALLDIAPTILSLTGEPPLPYMEGIPLFDKNGNVDMSPLSARKYVVCYAFNTVLPKEKYFAGIFTEDSTFVVDYGVGKLELFDYKNDADDEINVLNEFPDKAVVFQKYLEDWISSHNFNMDSIYNVLKVESSESSGREVKEFGN